MQPIYSCGSGTICLNGNCVICTPNTKWCDSAGDSWTCSSDGAIKTKASCGGIGCKDGICQTYAIDQKWCSGSSVLTSDDGFTSKILYTCQAGCSNGNCIGECTDGAARCSGLQYAQICAITIDQTLPLKWNTVRDCGPNNCDPATNDCKSFFPSGTTAGSTDGKTILIYNGTSPIANYLTYCPLGWIPVTGGYACRECSLGEKKCGSTELNPIIGEKQPIICADNKTTYIPLGVQCPNIAGTSQYGYCLNGECVKSCTIEDTLECSADGMSVFECESVYLPEKQISCGVGCIQLSDTFAQCDTLSFILEKQSFILPSDGTLRVPMRIDSTITEAIYGKTINARICSANVECTPYSVNNIIKEIQVITNSIGEAELIFTGLTSAGDYQIIMSISTIQGPIEQTKIITTTNDVVINVLDPVTMTAFTGGDIRIKVDVRDRSENLLDVTALALKASIGNKTITPKIIQKAALGTYEIIFDNPQAGLLTLELSPEVSLQKLTTTKIQIEIKAPYVKVVSGTVASMPVGTHSISAATYDISNNPIDVDKLVINVKTPLGKEDTLTALRLSKGRYEETYNFEEAGPYTITFIPYKNNYDTVKTSSVLTITTGVIAGVVPTKIAGVSIYYIIGAIIAGGFIIWLLARKGR